jgi:regulator of sirC expression with transglutaminase-like and TPR domain
MSSSNGNPTLTALINLLDEPDEKAFALISGQILMMGANAVTPLETALENTFDSLVRERILSIIRKLNRDVVFDEFSDWLQTGSSDLLRGFILVSRIQHPSLDEQDIIIQVEQLKVDIWIELHENLTALEHVKVINHLLFDIHHYQGNKSDLVLAEHSRIDILLEAKKGSPLALGVLYMILAQKLGLPLYGVNLPQHFILAYLTDTGIETPGEEDVLFYVNPFNSGAVFTRREIELFIGQMKFKSDKSYFTPCTNPDIIRRLINNLIFLYNQSGRPDVADDLEILLNAFK